LLGNIAGPADPAEADMQRVLSQLPHQGVNLALEDFDVLLAHPTLYGDEQITRDIQSFTSNNTDYDDSKVRLLTEFFEIIRGSPIFAPLSEVIELPNTRTSFKFFCIVKGDKSEAKFRLINAVVTYFCTKHVKHGYRHHDLSTIDRETFAKAQYEPNVMDQDLRVLFKIMKDNGVLYQKSDFGSQGTFAAYLHSTWDAVCILRPDFGTRPNRAPVEMDAVEHFKATDPPYRPHENYQDLLDLSVYMFSEYKGLRSGKEVSSLWFRQRHVLSRFGYVALR
jgi:hypothetical protein